MKIPVVAWEIDSVGDATPVVPCSPMTERWAVLMPTGEVIVDEYTGLDYKAPITLTDWIKDEVEWAESPKNATSDFWTASEIAFERRGHFRVPSGS